MAKICDLRECSLISQEQGVALSSQSASTYWALQECKLGDQRPAGSHRPEQGWEHKGGCPTHTGVGGSQVETGKNIFAKDTELQSMLRTE